LQQLLFWYMPRSYKSIYSALAANIAIAATKFVAGGISKSSAMISEAVHSLIDSINELLLLYGIHRSNKEKDKMHPFGYGRELYFWSFIVSILIFALGAGVSFYQGYQHLKHPSLSNKLSWNYIVLAFAFLFDGGSFVIALREFNKTRREKSLWQDIRKSKDPSNFAVLFEDGAAVLGLLVVFSCLYIGEKTGNPYLDGIASLLVGLILTAASVLLARESRSLLIGEGISAQTEQQIAGLIKKFPQVTAVKRMFSIYQSPDEVLLVMILSFKPEITTAELNETITQIKKEIGGKYAKISHILIQPE
jgi:cation diffusion facilitator family transporter